MGNSKLTKPRPRITISVDPADTENITKKSKAKSSLKKFSSQLTKQKREIVRFSWRERSKISNYGENIYRRLIFKHPELNSILDEKARSDYNNSDSEDGNPSGTETEAVRIEAARFEEFLGSVRMLWSGVASSKFFNMSTPYPNPSPTFQSLKPNRTFD